LRLRREETLNTAAGAEQSNTVGTEDSLTPDAMRHVAVRCGGAAAALPQRTASGTDERG